MNIQWSSGQDSTASSDIERIRSTVHELLERSSKVMSFPLIERDYENPLTEEEKNAMIGAVKRAVALQENTKICKVVTDAIVCFTQLRILRPLCEADNHTHFFQICTSFDLYLEHLTEWLNTLLAPLYQQQAEPASVARLVNVAYREIYKFQYGQVLEYFLERARWIRKSQSYLADWAFKSMHTARFLKTIRKIYSFYHGNHHHADSWQSQYISLVKKHVTETVRSMPNETDLREFLAIVTAAWNQEWELYSRTFSVLSCTKAKFKEIILKPVHQNYVYRRNHSYHSYFSVDDLMRADDRTFDGRLLADLFLIVTFCDECYTYTIDVLKRSLHTHFREKCVKKVEEMLSEKIDSPQWNLEKFMENYWTTSTSYTRKWREALQGSLRLDQIEYLKKIFSEDVFDTIKTRKAIENIGAISKACAEYLCGVRGPRQRSMRIASIIDFYRTVADRKGFVKTVLKTFVRNLAAGRRGQFQYLYIFCENENVSGLSDELKGLLRCVKESQDVSEYINQEIGWDEGTDENANPKMKVSGVIIPEKYRPQYEANLLRKPKELVDIDKRFVEQAKARANPEAEERLYALNAQSYLKVKTKIFGANKGPITLILTVYQLSVVCCLRRKRKMTVVDLCSALTRADVTERNDKLRARKVVKLVLMSLLQPYQLIKIFAEGSRRTPKEISPSKPEDISRSHYVVLYNKLQPESEPLELRRPDLSIPHVDEVGELTDNNNEEEDQVPRRRNPTIERVAERAVFATVRQRCTASPHFINENDTISRIYNNLRVFGATMQDIQHALETHIQAGTIERHQQEGTNMLKFVNRNDLD